MSGVGDPTGDEIMQAFVQRHRTNITSPAHGVYSYWSCSCGKHGPDTTYGRATAGRDTHLRTAHRSFIAVLAARLEGRREFGGTASPCDVCGRGTAMRETTDGENWAHRCDVDSRVLTEVLASMLDAGPSPGKMES